MDPELRPLTYVLVDPPGGMTVDPDTGLVSWTPTTAGIYDIVVQVTDEGGAVGSQGFKLEVLPPNAPPVITSSAPGGVTVGGMYHYDVEATDPDGDTLRFSLLEAPPDMRIHSGTGLIAWRPELSDEGSHEVTVLVEDIHQESDSQPFTIDVGPDLEPPTVVITYLEEPAVVNQPFEVCIGAADNLGVTTIQMSAGGADVPLDSRRCGTFTPDAVGSVLVLGEAFDASGNRGEVTWDVPVIPEGPTGAPAVAVDSIVPAPGSLLTAPVDVFATVTDDIPATLSWEVRVAPAGSEEWQVIGTGSGEVIDGVVAHLDTSAFSNGTYRVQIEGNDGEQTGGLEFEYNISGALKLGAIGVSFTDLRIPVAGIPLVVTREYSSLDVSQKDFGAGWRLGLPGRVSDSPVEYPDNDLLDILAKEGFAYGTRVYVTRPDGRRIGFSFEPSPVVVAGGSVSFQMWLPQFTPDPGGTDTLEEACEAPTSQWIGLPPSCTLVSQGSSGRFGIGLVPFAPYNPRTYVLTTEDGVRYTIDEYDGLQHIEDANGNTITVGPDGLVSSTGVALEFIRDGAGRITRIIEPDDPGDTDPPGELEYVYDGAGNLVSFFDQLDHETRYFYEEAGFPHYLTRVEDPLLRPILRTVFDADGRVLGQCEAGGDPVTLEGCFQYSHDPDARLETVIDANGNRIDLFLDERGNALTERRWLDELNYLDTVRTYDAGDRVLTESDPLGNTTYYTYDARGNMLTRTGPDDQTWTFTYTASDEVETRCDPQGNCIRNTYDEAGNLRFVEDPLGGVTEHRYNAAGQRVETIDAVGNSWVFTYDAAGFPETQTDPLGNTATTVYAPNGELITKVDREGRVTTYEYDEAHRLIEETWDTVPPTIITYGYNAAGQVTSVMAPDSALVIDYWNTGKVKLLDPGATPGAPPVSVTYGYLDAQEQLRPGYDANGNVTHVTDSSGGLTEYGYDALGRIVWITQSNGAAASSRQPRETRSQHPDRTGRNVIRAPAHSVAGNTRDSALEKRVDLVYDDAGLLREILRSGDLAGLLPVVRTDYDYDCSGCPYRVTAVRHRDAGDDSVIHDIDVSRDELGNVLSSTDAEGSHSYQYDGFRRLLGADHPGAGPQPQEFYTYDYAGNRLSSHLSAAYTYGYMLAEGGNRLRQDDTFDYDYDNNGNLVSRTDRATGEALEFVYDHRDRLVEITRLDSGGVPVGTTTYLHDGANRRIRSDEDGNVSWYVYDGRNPLLKTDGTGAVISRRLYSRTLDEILADEAGGNTRWFLTDGVGSVRDLVGNDGSVLNHYVYDSFGRMLAASAPGVINDLLFNGREFDLTTGLGHYRARFYDPTTGRFLQVDPRSPFRYEFANNNPQVFLDPTGEVAVIEYGMILCDISAPLSFGYGTVGQPLAKVFEAVAAGLNGEPVDGEEVAREYIEALRNMLLTAPVPCGIPVPL
jgi:RHS repeat-associated protein